MRYLLVIPLALFLAHSTASAQRCERVNTIMGKVVDAVSGAPVATAWVEASDDECRTPRRSIRTNDAGEFKLDLPFDRGHVRIRSTGYVTSSALRLSFDVTRRIQVLDFALAPIDTIGSLDKIIPIEGLLVVAQAAKRSPVLTEFDIRVARGHGWFITAAEIQQRNPSRVTDLFTAIPGLDLISSGQGFQRVISFHRNNANPLGCPAQIYLDGQLVTKPLPQGPGFTVDDLVIPGDLEGVEIYHGLSSVPAEFINPNSRCGVVVLWTKRAW